MYKLYQMVSKTVFVFTFLLFIALCNVTVGGRDLSKQAYRITKIQGENSSSSTVRSFAEKVGWYKHGAGYYSDGRWHGVRARINVWTIPDVQPKSFSAAYIAAMNRGQMIAAGVHVYPDLYKNNELRFFTYWTDGVSTCYNTQCKGFVVANGTNSYPGQALAPPFSTYGGEQKYITLRIKKDEQTGDWSLYREDQGGPIGDMTLLGWWPKSLFRDLSDYAPRIEWKGLVSYHSDERSPSMGSGHYAKEYEGKAAFFQNILAFMSNGKRFDPGENVVFSNVDKPGCYDASAWFMGNHDGCHFFYGGPSGCSDE